MPEANGLVLTDERHIKVSGCLDVGSVAEYKDEGIRLMEPMSEPVFDLAEIEARGSAAIALLIAWQRHAANSGKEISFINAPPNLVEIAEACGVSDIVPFR